MQKIKYIYRQVGTGENMVSGDAFSEYLETYTEEGYELREQRLDPIPNGSGGIDGYRIFVTLVKNEVPTPEKQVAKGK